EIHGTGSPLVLIHGGGSTIATSFGAVLPALAKSRQVIGVELQGHGHTAALLKILRIPKADFFGYSNGGDTALQMGIRHPGVVRKLIVESAMFRNDGLYQIGRASCRESVELGGGRIIEKTQTERKYEKEGS